MLQVAPDTIDFEITAANDSQMTISQLSDTSVGYRINKLDGVDESVVLKQPLMTIQHRPATVQNGATKYTIKVVHPVYDPLNKLLGSMLISADVVVPTQYLLHPENKLTGMLQSIGAITSSDLLADMANSGSFLR